MKERGGSRVGSVQGRVQIATFLSCGNMCFAWRKECNKCNQPRGGGGEFYTAGGRGGYARGGARGGWQCLSANTRSVPLFVHSSCAVDQLQKSNLRPQFFFLLFQLLKIVYFSTFEFVIGDGILKFTSQNLIFCILY